MTLPATYITRDQVKDALDRSSLPNAHDPTFDQAISTAGQIINNYCRRHFDLIAETRVFDAPGSTRLQVADLQPSPAPVVVQDGTTLTRGTDYYLQPQLTVLHPAYTYLVRVQGGYVRRWGYRAQSATVVSVPMSRGGLYDEYLVPASPYGLYAPAASESVITIAGTWGYSAVVPGPIQQAAEMLTVRIWQSRQQHYIGTGEPGTGTSTLPLILLTQDIKDLLDPYVRPELPEERDE